MRRLAALLIGLAFLALAVPASASPVPQALFPSYVSGMVVNETGAPLPGVAVSAANFTTGVSYGAVTDQSGAYNISVPIGKYNVTASLEAHTPNRSYVGLVAGAAGASGIDFTMIEILGMANGFVTSGQAPVSGATVYLTSGQTGYSANSSSLGFYQISGIKPGTYVARAEKTGYNTSIILDPVTIGRGEIVQINFTMVAQPAKLSGTVTVGGAVEEGVQVLLLVDGGTMVKQTVTDANGNYSFSNIVAGDYKVQFKMSGLVDKEVDITLQAFENRVLSVTMDREPVQGSKGFIGDLDLTHSLMVVALIVIMLLMLIALFIFIRSRKHPEILAIEEEPEPKEEDKHKKEK